MLRISNELLANASTAIIVGVEPNDVLMIPDAVTGYDHAKPLRPCFVVQLEPGPPKGAYVLPRSTKTPPRNQGATFVPKGVLRGLNKDGWFEQVARFVTIRQLESCENLGALPEPYASQVRSNVNEGSLDPGAML